MSSTCADWECGLESAMVHMWGCWLTSECICHLCGVSLGTGWWQCDSAYASVCHLESDPVSLCELPSVAPVGVHKACPRRVWKDGSALGSGRWSHFLSLRQLDMGEPQTPTFLLLAGSMPLKFALGALKSWSPPLTPPLCCTP